jgi:DNA polymerase-4
MGTARDSSSRAAALCRDCLTVIDAPAGPARCPHCNSPRVVSHPELLHLSIAHLDCDAFYAAVEKRDDPGLADKPLIIGGDGPRGVVSTACYIARMSGVHSAMPMFKAKKLCPNAVIMPPNMKKYAEVGGQVRKLMRDTTPLVEPLSLDEAFLDLSGTERLHRRSPAETLAGLAKRVEQDIAITVSIGLSYNKFLAKLCSDLDKPRGFSVLGRAEAPAFLAARPVSNIWGVGRALNKRLQADGINLIGQLQTMDERDLMARYGSMGQRLWAFSRGKDSRTVDPDAPAKSISAETTFDRDITDLKTLDAVLWRLSEKVSQRLKAQDKAGNTITLKLKAKDFKQRTRSQQLPTATQLADVIYRQGRLLLEKEIDGTAFRLLGIGASGLTDDDLADAPDLLDPTGTRKAHLERTMDTVRAKFGGGAIRKGRGLS